MLRSFSVVAAILLSVFVYGQETIAPPARVLQKVLSLKIDRPGGIGGAAVAWHPMERKYYAAQAGPGAPMMIFDEKGKKITATDLTAGVDVRGFWYNPTSRTLQATTAGNNGWYEYAVNERGVPENRRRLKIETGLQSEDAIGAYNAVTNAVYFYDHTHLMAESRGLNGLPLLDKVKLRSGTTEKDDTDAAKRTNDYNINAIVYTGQLGLLNVAKKQVELYDPSTGSLTQILRLPDNAPVSKSFNLSYCNNTYWLFNPATREWTGYRVK